MRLYVAGPMSGIPHFNIPLFDQVATTLRLMGHEVINPAEEDPPPVRAAALASAYGDPADLLPTGSTHGDLLARDVKLIADGIDGIVLLANWWKSKGACLEAFTALTYGKPLFRLRVIGDIGVELCERTATERDRLMERLREIV
ncbi:MAG TPA: DUF4406 domain-containing protein [Burkholderiaceae bacterium]|nr:DUF4406 domain-containing protein [Burkholderiaceae bacterium]